MSAFTGVATGLQAALLLARGRAEGVSLLAAEGEPAMTVAARSFWAAALCLPAFVCLQLVDWAHAPTPGLPPHAAHAFALDLLGPYVIGWAGYALLSHWLAGVLGRADRWQVFIAAWNWCGVVQYLLLVIANLTMLLGLPDIVWETSLVVATGWGLWLEWFATRHALDISPIQAVGLVLLEQAMEFGMFGIIASLQG